MKIHPSFLTRRPRPNWVAAVLLSLTVTGGLPAAELVTLSPDNYDEYAPVGKQVEAVFGDYVLRNDHLIAVVADPTTVSGRSGGRRVAPDMRGRVIDLTRRDQPNDLLGSYEPLIYIPAFRDTPRPQGLTVEPHRQGAFRLARDAHTLPGREPQSGRRITLTLPWNAPVEEIRYVLEDGWEYLLVELEFHNTGNQPVTIRPKSFLQMGGHFADIDDDPNIRYGLTDDGRMMWKYDPWYGQAYGVVAIDHRLTPFFYRPRQMWLFQRPVFDNGTDEFTLEPGQRRVLARKLIPGRDVFEIRAVLQRREGIELHPLHITVLDNFGPVAGVDVAAHREDEIHAMGRTDSQGRLTVELPAETFDIRARTPLGREVSATGLNPAAAGDLELRLEPNGKVAVRVRDDRDQPVPCRVRFDGLGETPDPVFFPRTGIELVGQAVHTVTGEFEQVLPLGRYRLSITRGPEYNMVSREIEITGDDTVHVEAILERAVDTPGWISAEFANPTCRSRTWARFWSLGPPEGRVRNLLAEGIQFAPATEIDRISTFKPIIEALNAGHLLATADGIHLSQQVRKTFTAQNVFPLTYVHGDLDGGIPQRPQHVLQIWWAEQIHDGNPPQHRINERGDILQTGGSEKLFQVTPPNIWPNDGRHEGMAQFSELNMVNQTTIRGNRLSKLGAYHAMQLQPLTSFLDIPAFDPDDPKGENDIRQWWESLAERGRNNWPQVPHRNREWLRMLNLGYRITGVVNNMPRFNDESGYYRNYIHLGHENPAEIDPLDVVRAVKAGRVIMTTGPFIDVRATTPDGRESAMPGDSLHLPDGQGILRLRIQCADWVDVDRVSILLNGRVAKTLTRAEHPDFFDQDSAVRFRHDLPLTIEHDTHVIIIADGEGPNLRPHQFDGDRMTHIAMANPVYLHLGADGFKPHSPSDDQVFTRLEVRGELASGRPLDVRLVIHNHGDETVTDVFVPELRTTAAPQPNAAADMITDAATDAAGVVADLAAELMEPDTPPEPRMRIVPDEPLRYTLQPGERKTVDFKVIPEQELISLRLIIPRSSVGVGRRAAGLILRPGRSYDFNDTLTNYGRVWMPEHNPALP